MGNSIRVLLVDDDPAIAGLAATYLERVNDRIETVVESEPQAALNHVVESDDVDCVVSDYDMPDSNGLEFLASVRRSAPDLPFILFTGKGSEEIASEAISAGVTDYLQKGNGTEQYEVLANRVENAVGQHRAEREAAEASAQMRRIFERVTDSFYALDDDLRVTYANGQAASYAGLSREELIGRDIRSVLPPSDAGVFYDAFEEAFETNEPVTLETDSVLRPETWLDVRVYPSDDGLSVYIRDVSERRRARREVRETKRKIEALHDVATQAVTCTTAQAVYDLAVEAAEETLAFDLCAVDALEGEELVPQAVSKGVPTDGYYDTTSVDADDKMAARTFRTGESSVVEDLRETGVVPAENVYRSALTVAIGDYGVLQAVSEDPNAFDDDDRELAEVLAAHVEEALARLQSQAELRDERDRFAALFENLPNAVVRYSIDDGEAIAESVNPAFEEVFGWREERIVGGSVDRYILPEGHEDEGHSLNWEVSRGNRIEGVEVHRNTSDGVRDFLLHTAPVAAEGRTEAFAIYVDITEQKERERKLAGQNERLEEFASVVSHDLRNPLNVAHGRFEMLVEELDGESEHVPPLSRALDRMDALVGDLLALARRGQLVDESERVSLSAAAESAWTTVRTGDATLELDDDVAVEADDARFRELLENLFRNSVEHGSRGSRTKSDDAVEHRSTSNRPADDDAVEHGSTSNRSSSDDAVSRAGEDVTVEVGRLDDGAGFYVADDGPGIPESLRERVFDHGYTTSADGTGFGLAIVSTIAEAHGWDVRVEANAPSGGARFVFSQVTVHEPAAEQ